MQESQGKLSWRSVKKLDRAKELVDFGLILKWKDVKAVLHVLTEAEQAALISHLAERLAERCDDRLATEIVVESILSIVGHLPDEKMLQGFFNTFFKQRNAEEASRILVEIACSSEATDLEYDDEMFSIAIVLICELGLALRRFEAENPGEFENVETCFDHIATYLLSVSNCNNHCVRLSLIAYFGRMNDVDRQSGARLNKILLRFGQTVLDGLMLQLFDKRSEAVALQFLQENLHFWLEADVNVQRIIHESFKHHMLKHPERFVLFLQATTKSLSEVSTDRMTNIRRVYAQHLGALYQVADEVGHRVLGRDVLHNMVQMKDSHSESEILYRLRAHPNLRPQFKEMIAAALDTGNIGDVGAVHSMKGKGAKRGRKPSMTSSENLGTMEQVAFLGARLAKAS